jgi:cytidine deaminase
MCAERILLWEWQANHADDPIEAFAIASVPAQRECYPCGGCRQVLVDTERRQGSPIRIIMSSDTTTSVVGAAKYLLPFGFEL